MDDMIAQIAGIFSTLLVILSGQIKDVKKILICQVFINAFGCLSYVLLGGFSGSSIYFVAIMQCIVFYIIRVGNKTAPKWLAALFAVAFIACSVSTYSQIWDIFSACAAICCAICLSQEKAANYRLFMLFNGVLWIVYDVSVGAYAMILSHIVTAVSALVGMIRLDLKKN